jgi:hypothetical protein
MDPHIESSFAVAAVENNGDNASELDGIDATSMSSVHIP